MKQEIRDFIQRHFDYIKLVCLKNINQIDCYLDKEIKDELVQDSIFATYNKLNDVDNATKEFFFDIPGKS